MPKVVRVDRDLRVVGPVGCLTDSEGPAVRLLGSIEVAPFQEHAPKVVRVDRDLRVVGPVGCLTDSEGPAVRLLGGIDVTSHLEHIP